MTVYNVFKGPYVFIALHLELVFVHELVVLLYFPFDLVYFSLTILELVLQFPCSVLLTDRIVLLQYKLAIMTFLEIVLILLSQIRHKVRLVPAY